VDAIAQLRAKDVIDEPVLGDATESAEGVRGDDRVEVVPIAGNLGAGTRNLRLDPVLQFLRGRAHCLKRSEMLSLY
jgi:hypothetical protein